MGALALDERRYGRVLARVLPRIIADEVEYQRVLGEIETLMDKGERRTLEEDAAMDLLVRLVQDYEREHHPLDDPAPHEMLVYLMEKQGLRQVDLAPIFKSRGYASDVINGKREISKAHAKQLAACFRVSVEVFL